MVLQRVISACALVLLAGSSAQAGLCVPPTVEKNSPYRYLLSLANAMVYANEGLGRAQGANAGTDEFSLIVSLRLQRSDYQCAESQVAPYATSSDSVIKDSAEGAALVFHRLQRHDDDLIAQLKALLDSSATVNPGTLAERLADVQSAIEQTWGMMPHVAALSTYTAIRVDPSTRKMSRLALSAEERDEILGVLRTGFGKGIIGGMKEGQYPLEGAAAVLYQVIGNPQYQLRQK